MTKRMIGTVAALTWTAAGLQAQGVGVGIGVGGGGGRLGPPFVEQFQQAGTFSAVGVARGGSIGGVNLSTPVVGRPVSGMEERKSTQKLEDGTMIETSEQQLFFRDSSGRTRTEMPKQNRIIIMDPVAHTQITLNGETKMASRVSLPTVEGTRAVGPPNVELAARAAKEAAAVQFAGGSYTFTLSDSATATTITTDGAVTAPATVRRVVRDNENRKHEELGAESLNGVLAMHTRDTLTIPQGQIGNDRDIHVVNDRWYSDDLQMLVKTENSDPRFGKNTYELTNVLRDEPNPSLFQVPGDYTIRDIGIKRDVMLPATVNK
jgi:hypothetical protein